MSLCAWDPFPFPVAGLLLSLTRLCRPVCLATACRHSPAVPYLNACVCTFEAPVAGLCVGSRILRTVASAVARLVSGMTSLMVHAIVGHPLESWLCRHCCCNGTMKDMQCKPNCISMHAVTCIFFFRPFPVPPRTQSLLQPLDNRACQWPHAILRVEVNLTSVGQFEAACRTVHSKRHQQHSELPLWRRQAGHNLTETLCSVLGQLITGAV
jgi:hypothetical protein